MKIVSGYVLECTSHEDAETHSYEDMKGVGRIRCFDNPKAFGADLKDTPFSSNGAIESGLEIEVFKGDYVIIIRK